MASPLEHILDHAPGNWDRILSHFTNSFDDALSKIGRHVSCPYCGATGKNGFRMKRGFADNGRTYCSCKSRSGLYILTELEGVFKDHREGIFEVAKFLGWEKGQQRQSKKRHEGPSTQEREAQRLAKLNSTVKVENRLSRLKGFWFQTYELKHPLAALGRDYLRSRGLLLPNWMETPYVRFSPETNYFDEDEKFVGTFPALVFLVKAAGLPHPQAVHKIYLTPNGAKLETVNSEWTSKKSSGYVVKEYAKGLSIPLYRKEGCKTLNVAEGQETAWAVALITAEDTDSCIDAGKLANMRVKKTKYDKVRIWADKDKSQTGQIKATELANRLMGEGFEVEIMLPNMAIPNGMKSIDWLDIWAMVPVEKIKKLTAKERMDGFYRMSCREGLRLSEDRTALESLKYA